MAALGCFFPILFLIGGVVVGGMLGGQQGSVWGGAAGALIGCAALGSMLYALVIARRRS